MSGHLFPIKINSIFHELAKTSSFEKMRHCHPVKTPDNNLIRLVLMSPEVQQAVALFTGEKYFRIRLAIPHEINDLVKMSNTAQLEIYDGDGNLMREPIKLKDLDINLSNAVQVELFHEILRGNGIHIPLL